MDALELRALLDALRLVRAGTRDPTKIGPPLSRYLGMGTGRLCDLLASWMEACPGTDRRGVDAAIRYYGLGRMPEELTSIAEGLRHLYGERRRALDPRQVENLRDEVVRKVAASSPPCAFKTSSERILPLADRFPPPLLPGSFRDLDRPLLWAWADVVDARDGNALLLYEMEHGLRSSAPSPPTRTHRSRWRRRAWTMLDVASYRLAESAPSDPVVDRVAGPRHLAVVDLPNDALSELLLLDVSPVVIDAREALEVVRKAVRARHPEAPELLGVLRDAIIRSRKVDSDIRSKVLALTAILARERRDPSGSLAGFESRMLLRDVESLPRTDEVRRTVVSDALRATQEAAQLEADLGDLTRAWHTARSMQDILEEFGDPESDEEPDGWRQQQLQYAASLDRRLARRSRRPQEWLTSAGHAAELSAGLVFDGSHDLLPPTWGLAARAQQLGVAVDLARANRDSESRGASFSSLRVVRRRCDELEADWRVLDRSTLSEGDRRHVELGLLGTARAEWRIALIEGDLNAVDAARQTAWLRIGPWIPPMFIDELRELDRQSQRAGLSPFEEPVIVVSATSRYHDRSGVRP